MSNRHTDLLAELERNGARSWPRGNRTRES